MESNFGPKLRNIVSQRTLFIQINLPRAEKITSRQKLFSADIGVLDKFQSYTQYRGAVQVFWIKLD